ncbi:MAG: hypothetical protein V5A64_00310 [Candidatus Thermoplasmatota archaeon]
MELLEDDLNLYLLRYLVSGEGVSVNIRSVARELDIHRATAKRRISFLYDKKILNPPFYSFPQLYKEYPLLILVKADMPRTQEVKDFLKDDSHVFAAFSCMEGPYNTFLMEFFEDLKSYHSWREQIVADKKIPTRHNRAAASANIFSNNLTFKYEPNCFVKELRKEFDRDGFVQIGDVRLGYEKFSIMYDLTQGKHLQRNDSFLSRELGVNRKTIKHRVGTLLDAGVIDPPKCFFPNLFIPPTYNLVVSLIEVKSGVDDVKKYIMDNNNISRAQEASTGRYNFLIFSAFKTIEHFFDTGRELISRFPNAIGDISNTILSSKMIHTIKPQKLSLGWIERKLWELKQK